MSENNEHNARATRPRSPAVGDVSARTHEILNVLWSGSVLDELRDDLAGYETSKGSLRFAIDDPLPDGLVQELITARLRELGAA